MPGKYHLEKKAKTQAAQAGTNNAAATGKKLDETETAEPLQPLPEKKEYHPVEARPPSSDPELLRLAYGASQAAQRIRYQLQSIPLDVQLAMYEEYWPTPIFNPDLKWLQSSVEAISRLPGLTEHDLKNLAALPDLFRETADNLRLFDERLKRKKEAQADLETAVESTLALINELRLEYLNRLRNGGG